MAPLLHRAAISNPLLELLYCFLLGCCWLSGITLHV